MRENSRCVRKYIVKTKMINLNDMNKPFFSIIVPIYKVENYLNQCVESVINQTFDSYELILVDDGSTDRCPIICDEYAKKNKKIIAIHKDNGGLSSARNAGIKIACGEYLLFLDSDDYWESNKNLEDLYDVVINSFDAKVIVFASKHLFPNSYIVNDLCDWENKYYYSGLETLKTLIRNNLIVGSACTKAIKRKFFIENNLFFIEGIKSEDIEWTFRLCSLLPSYYYYNSHFYIYRQMREGSITNTIDTKHICQLYETISNYCDSNTFEKNVKEVFYNYIAYQFSLLCAFVSNINDSIEKKNMLNNIKNYSWILKYNMYPRMKKISFFYKVFGFKITAKVLGLALLIRNKKYIQKTEK